jgi:hypothetical protein
MSAYQFAHQKKQQLARDVVASLQKTMNIKQNRQLVSLDDASPGLINDVTPILEEVDKWYRVALQSASYVSLTDLPHILDSVKHVEEAFMALVRAPLESFGPNRKDLLDNIDSACAQAETYIHRMVGAYLYANGLANYASLGSNLDERFNRVKAAMTGLESALNERENTIREREDKLGEIASSGAGNFDRDSSRIRQRLGWVSLALLAEIVAFVCYASQWSQHVDWLITSNASVNSYLYFYAGITSKIAGTFLLLVAIVMTIRLFRSYLNMLELNHHRVTLLQTLQPIALVAPSSMKDAIYVKVVDIITRYDSLDHSQKDVSNEAIDKLAGMSSIQHLIR